MNDFCSRLECFLLVLVALSCRLFLLQEQRVHIIVVLGLILHDFLDDGHIFEWIVRLAILALLLRCRRVVLLTLMVELSQVGHDFIESIFLFLLCLLIHHATHLALKGLRNLVVLEQSKRLGVKAIQVLLRLLLLLFKLLL